MFRLSPARLDCAAHPGKFCLPVPFPHPYRRAPTSFIRFQRSSLFLSVRTRATLSPSSGPPRSTVATAHVPEYYHPGFSSQGRHLRYFQFVVPVKLNAPILEAHVDSQVVGMAVSSLYHANAPHSSLLASIQHSHQRAFTRLMTVQAVRLLVVQGLRPDAASVRPQALFLSPLSHFRG